MKNEQKTVLFLETDAKVRQFLGIGQSFFEKNVGKFLFAFSTHGARKGSEALKSCSPSWFVLVGEWGLWFTMAFKCRV